MASKRHNTFQVSAVFDWPRNRKELHGSNAYLAKLEFDIQIKFELGSSSESMFDPLYKSEVDDCAISKPDGPN